MRFAKGHGTGNDFLILPDPGGALELSPDLVRRLCDRHTGLGADGVLRVVRTGSAGPDTPHVLRGAATAAEWFMDYRNADGSIAEMCGNGIRVFARYLLRHGLAGGPDIVVMTRSGARAVTEEPDGSITVDMGAPQVLGRSGAVVAGISCEGLEISLGNPHLACLVDRPVSVFDLSAPPLVDPSRFPDGANVEVVRVTGDRSLEMRVYERGSGATLSCGTGAVAAAVAAAAGRQPAQQPVLAAGTWSVRVPGGELSVTLTGTTSLLSGPAEIVAEGEADEAALRAEPLGTSPGPA
jgi:diaminopimelate epimerase